MKRLYASYSKLKKSEQAFKPNSNSPRDMESNTFWTCWNTSSADDSAGTYRDTSISGADQYSSIGLNQYIQHRDKYQGRISTSIDISNIETSIGVDQYNSRIRSIHHTQILTTTAKQIGREPEPYWPSCIRDFVS